MTARLALVSLAGLLAAGCAGGVGPLVEPHASAVALTGGPNTSMVFLARTDSGVVAIDLGWWGAEAAVRGALASLDATPDSVRHVFLTHSHRDHVGAWRLVAGSEFHLAAPELRLLIGEAAHGGAVPRWAEHLRPSDLPASGELDARPFAADTMFVFGADTLRAYIVPGHTAGSAAYLFRGILFLGDAATWTPWGGFAPAMRIHSEDRRQAMASLEALWKRLPTGAVAHVCTAHARCRPFGAELAADVLR